MMEHFPVILIDVRTKEQYDQGHLRGAVNIPYEQFSGHQFQKEATYIVYCDHGIQSMRAARDLALEGYKVFNIMGGIKGTQRH